MLTHGYIYSSGLSLRDRYVLSYAEYLHSDPGLWRLTVDYMYSCGDIGKEMADEVLIRVPLELLPPPVATGAVNDEITRTARAGQLPGKLKDVNATCHHHKREGVRRAVCKVCSSASACCSPECFPA